MLSVREWMMFYEWIWETGSTISYCCYILHDAVVELVHMNLYEGLHSECLSASLHPVKGWAS